MFSLFQSPFIKHAQSLREKPIKLFASPWTAPAWMKSNKNLIGQGYLLPEYYPSWANYFVKFLDQYKEQGVEFWGLTAQNEPWDGLVPNFAFNAMGWNASMQKEWIVEHLGPSLEGLRIFHPIFHPKSSAKVISSHQNYQPTKSSVTKKLDRHY